jgi:hypothetical protein
MPQPKERAPSRVATGRLWIWIVYVVLFAVSIPWYLPADDAPALWFGLPYWVVISLAAYLVIAVFTAYVVQRHWPRDEDEP